MMGRWIHVDSTAARTAAKFPEELLLAREPLPWIVMSWWPCHYEKRDLPNTSMKRASWRGAFALTSTAPLRVLAKITYERTSTKWGQPNSTKIIIKSMPFGKEWEKEIDLQISPHLSPLPSSDFSPYGDLSHVQLRLAELHWCWFWGLCRNNAY